ncbi:MAG TPA: thioredoxin domain-containing protein, partial [Gemmatimonadaceae bacterium]
MAAHTPTDSNITRADLARIQGSSSAPVWVIEVSDFQCPFCKQWHDQTYPLLRDQYVKTGKVRLAYVNFPLAIHAHAM